MFGKSSRTKPVVSKRIRFWIWIPGDCVYLEAEDEEHYGRIVYNIEYGLDKWLTCRMRHGTENEVLRFKTSAVTAYRRV